MRSVHGKAILEKSDSFEVVLAQGKEAPVVGTPETGYVRFEVSSRLVSGPGHLPPIRRASSALTLDFVADGPEIVNAVTEREGNFRQ